MCMVRPPIMMSTHISTIFEMHVYFTLCAKDRAAKDDSNKSTGQVEDNTPTSYEFYNDIC